MSKLTKFRKLTAIAPGLTVRAVNRQFSGEIIEMRGEMQSLNRDEAKRLFKFLYGWLPATEPEVVDAES